MTQPALYRIKDALRQQLLEASTAVPSWTWSNDDVRQRAAATLGRIGALDQELATLLERALFGRPMRLPEQEPHE